MAKRIFDLPETKGTFQVKGLVRGVNKQNFYTEKMTRTGKLFRMVNFGCEYDEKKSVYLSLNGMPQDNVYFSKRNKDTGKTDVKTVPWAMRESFNEDGYRMIGVNLGLEKTTNDDGKTVNDKKVMHAFDACDYMKSNMFDGASVFIRGNVEYSSFMDNNGELRKSQKFVPNQVSLCQDVDFTEYGDGNKPTHDFTQTIVFESIEQETVDGKTTGRFIVSAKIVTYNDIVDTEFVLTNPKLATNMKKNMKPYNAISVYGNIEVTHVVEEVVEDDGWGEVNPMKVVSAPSKIEMIITGADPSSIDKEAYTEASICDAIGKIRASQNASYNFGDSSNSDTLDVWGDMSGTGDDDDDLAWD